MKDGHISVAISQAISTAEIHPIPMYVGAMSKRNTKQWRQGSERWWQTSQSNAASMSEMRKHRSHLSNLPTSTSRAEVEKPVIRRARVDLLEHRSTRQRKVVRRAREARVQAQPQRVGIGETAHLSSQCPKKKVHAVEDLITGSSQGTTMVGAIGSYIDFGSVSE